MLYHLLYPLKDYSIFFNVFRYITFRTIYATLTALILTIWLTPKIIRKFREYGIGENIQEEVAHVDKQGTPTMGGIIILGSIFVSSFLWANLTSPYTWILLFSLFSFGAIGFYDDYTKLKRNRNKGLSAKQKFLLQILSAIIILLWWYSLKVDTRLTIPFFKAIHPDLGIFYLLLGIFIIVGSSNAVNLTDGLDGLAIGPLIITFATYLLFAYLAGHKVIADYLQVPYVPHVGEAAVICGAIVGSGLGFLWYNSHPAEIFMGDTGSLALGGALGTVALITRQELLLVLVGGIFVIETVSVILQVGYFKITGGKRILRMAPLHHHFEKKGWKEQKITVRFWIIAIILAMVAISTLKLR